MNKEETMYHILNAAVTWLTTQGIKIVISILVMVVSFFVINKIAKKVGKQLAKRKVDKTISKTVLFSAKVLLKIIVVMALLGYLGVETAGIATVLATIGVGISLAVQGTLSNFAGGLLILISRPFKDDDYIETDDVSGTVEDISIVYTHLRTPDNKMIVIPNGVLANSKIINYSKYPIRRLSLDFSISYDADYRKAIDIILTAYNSNEMILKDPAPFARMSQQADSALIITARCWVNNNDYWTVNFDMLEKIYNLFKENNIEIPYNQLDVNIKNQ